MMDNIKEKLFMDLVPTRSDTLLVMAIKQMPYSINYLTYLMGFDVGSKGNFESITSVKHLRAIPADNSSVNDGGRHRDILKLFPHESLMKLHQRVGKKVCLVRVTSC